MRGSADPGGGMPGQRIEATLVGDTLRLDYYAEVSALRIYKEARADNAGPEWARSRSEELRSAVRARWDNVDLPLSPLVVESPAKKGANDYVEFHLAAQATLPGDAGTIQLEMGNFPDEPCYMAYSVVIPGTDVVTASTLALARDGRLRENAHGAWQRDDKARVATLTLRPARPWEEGEAGPLPSRLEGLIPLPMMWKVVGGLLAVFVVGSLSVFFVRRARAG